MLKNRCQLWKIQLDVSHGDNGIFPTLPTLEAHTFWGYNFTEDLARAAAIRWAEEANPQAIINIKQVDLQP